MNKIEPKKVTFVIIAGGIGTRLGHKIPKQYLKIKDNLSSLQIIVKNISKFEYEKIIVVCSPKWKETVNEQLKGYDISIVKNGETRNKSIEFGLKHTKTDVVLIDSARPFITKEDISKILKSKRATVFASKMPSALYKVEDNKLISVEEKGSLLVAETPHFYTLEDVKNILINISEEYIDIPQILLKNDQKVDVIYSSFWKVKITTKEDLINAKKIFER